MIAVERTRDGDTASPTTLRRSTKNLQPGGSTKGSAAPVNGSIALVATTLSAEDGFLNHLCRNDLQLLILVLAQSTQPGHRLALGATRPTHQDADRPVDQAAALQRRLQLGSQPLDLR
jgi:hypothetical protein